MYVLRANTSFNLIVCIDIIYRGSNWKWCFFGRNVIKMPIIVKNNPFGLKFDQFRLLVTHVLTTGKTEIPWLLIVSKSHLFEKLWPRDHKVRIVYFLIWDPTAWLWNINKRFLYFSIFWWHFYKLLRKQFNLHSLTFAFEGV